MFIDRLRTDIGLRSKNIENTDVRGFAELIADSCVVLLDVRIVAEYAEGYIQGAILIDQGQSDFMEKEKIHKYNLSIILIALTFGYVGKV